MARFIVIVFLMVAAGVQQCGGACRTTVSATTAATEANSTPSPSTTSTSAPASTSATPAPSTTTTTQITPDPTSTSTTINPPSSHARRKRDATSQPQPTTTVCDDENSGDTTKSQLDSTAGTLSTSLPLCALSVLLLKLAI